MATLEQIGPDNAMQFKAVRLAALRDSPGAFGSTFAKESQYTDAEWSKRAVEWSSQKSIGYLAIDAENACGIAAAFLHREDLRIACVVSMWVAPGHRRSGIGRMLIDAINAWGRQCGAVTMRLNVTSNNTTAIEFYKRNGFLMTGNTEPYPNDPAIFEYEMTRPVLAV